MSRIPFDYQAFLKTCSQRAGVYQMFNDRGEMLYIGKAKNLKKRLSSYFRRSAPHAKVVALVSQIAKIEILITETENQALLLENNLIKKYRPKFNVLFRDDKSYPFIFVSADEYPRVDFHRGAKAKTGNYFGPYPSSGAVRQTINFLQKVFKIRTCQNSFFKNRSRPCIQYQIKRCTAPCVKYIEKENYNQSIALVKLFLQGKDKQIMELLGGKMQQAAKDLAYEKA
ncbi:MAG: GIY-YIG nuclease family protein, partial [Pseudomonadota bacterium]